MTDNVLDIADLLVAFSLIGPLMRLPISISVLLNALVLCNGLTAGTRRPVSGQPWNG